MKAPVCVIETDVAVTVTIDVTGWAGIRVALHPLRMLKPKLPTASDKSISKRRRFLMPKRQSTAASAEPGEMRLRLR